MGFFSSLFGGGGSTSVSQTSKNETTVNTDVSVDNQIDIIVDTDPIKQALDGLKTAFGDLGNLFAISKALELEQEEAKVKVGLVAESVKADAVNQRISQFLSLFGVFGKYFLAITAVGVVLFFLKKGKK